MLILGVILEKGQKTFKNKYSEKIRSNFNIYDEAGKIDPDFFALTKPFTVQDADFKTGFGINTELFPKQFQNKTLYSSSAEGIDSELFKQYKLCFQKMLAGDPDYFVADIDCNFSLHPFLNGKPAPPQLSQKTIDDAMETNPFRAKREYYNIFDSDDSQNTFIKRSVINKFSKPYFPEFENKDGKTKYIIAYDPATKLDNSIIMVGELFRDEEKGLMVKLVNCINLVEVLKNGEKRIIQVPEQIEKLKDIISDYSKGASGYENIQKLQIDAGAGGGGFQTSQFLIKEYKDKYGKFMPGMIDVDDVYMSIRQDDYPGADTRVLHMANFKKEKTQMYEQAQNMTNQGLIVFPEDLNVRNELTFTKTNEDGSIETRYEKANFDEVNALVQLSLLKEELTGIEKNKKSGTTIVFEQSIEAKKQGKHDDRADCFVLIASELAKLREKEALDSVEKPENDYKLMLEQMRQRATSKKQNNPFGNLGTNPFGNENKNPFA